MNVTIRPLAEREIGLLEQQVLRPPELHRNRLGMQQAGEATYLIAWYQGLPVGHALIKWTGTSREPMASGLAGCPSLSDLWINEEYRSRGIGSQLMEAAEQLIAERGFTRVGLAVAVDNTSARVLYERRGYRDAGFAEYTISWTAIDADGHEETVVERVVYLVKALGGDRQRA